MFDSPCHDAGTRSYVQPNDIEFSGERKRVRCNEGLGRVNKHDEQEAGHGTCGRTDENDEQGRQWNKGMGATDEESAGKRGEKTDSEAKERAVAWQKTQDPPISPPSDGAAR
jgi:hypothetical protein